MTLRLTAESLDDLSVVRRHVGHRTDNAAVIDCIRRVAHRYRLKDKRAGGSVPQSINASKTADGPPENSPAISIPRCPPASNATVERPYPV